MVLKIILSCIIKLIFIFDLILLTIYLYCKDKNEKIVNNLNLNDEYVKAKKEYKSNKIINKIFILLVILIILMMLIIFLAIFMSIITLGGIMYWEAGNPGGLFGRNTYEFITEIAFNYSFWIIGFSFVLSLGLFWYNLIALNISINKKLSLENNYKESKVDNEINLEKK